MKRKLVLLAKILVSVLLLWFLTHTSKLDFGLLTHLLYSPGLLSLTIILYFIVIGISSWRWYKLNCVQGIQLTYKRTILPTYLGVAFNNLLPGGVGGDFFRYYFVNKNIPTKRSVVMMSILFDRMTGLIGIFIAVVLCSLFNFNYFHENNITLYFLVLSLVLSSGVVFLFILEKYLPQKTWLRDWLAQFHAKKWCKPLVSLLEALHVYRNSTKTLIECLAASVLIQILIAGTCMLIANIMHFPALSFADYMMAIAFTQIANLIPIAPGGFGVGEIAFANVLILLNPSQPATYATIFLAYRLIGLLLYLPGVVIVIPKRSLLRDPSTKNVSG